LANNRFALDIYRRLCSSTDNIFFSPYSIHTAMGMVYTGAGTETKRQMASVLHFPYYNEDEVQSGEEQSNLKQLQESFQDLWTQITSPGIEIDYKLQIANALWIHSEYDVQKSYIAGLNEYFNSELHKGDFRHDSVNIADVINAWVSDKTNSKIPQLVTANDIIQAEVLILNAIYFKGDWLEPFDSDDTNSEDFFMLDGNIKKCSMMYQTSDFQYGENSHFQMIELPYANKKASGKKDSTVASIDPNRFFNNNIVTLGSDFSKPLLSMVVLLPKKNIGLPKVEQWIADTAGNALKKLKLKSREVRLYLPKFKMKKELDVKKMLQSLGLKDSFDEVRADFSVISPRKDIFITDIRHKAFIKVNEEGTEAAAVTVIAVMSGHRIEPKYKIFRADRPFLFYIRHNPSNTILFMGRVMEPEE